MVGKSRVVKQMLLHFHLIFDYNECISLHSKGSWCCGIITIITKMACKACNRLQQIELCGDMVA
jgi:hypothetical protein